MLYHQKYKYLLILIIYVSGSGLINFDSFVKVASRFMENEDEEVLQKELKEAFRLYDKEGKNHFITQYTVSKSG